MAFADQPPIPGYEPIRLLGINLGTVFLARHSSSGTLVALKVFLREHEEYLREHHAPLAQLDHPNIIRVLGRGEFERYSYYALEYVDRSLADDLRRGPLPLVEAVRHVLAITSALQHARDRGMVVRSLTPSSVSLDERNTPKLADFRPAGKLPTSSIIQSYTPFMAPEELEGLSTVATDVYQVGALLYAMLTGSPPVSGTSAVEVVRNVLEARPEPPRKVNPRLGRGLEAVCLKCLEKQPVARCSVEELVSKLKSLEESLE